MIARRRPVRAGRRCLPGEPAMMRAQARLHLRDELMKRPTGRTPMPQVACCDPCRLAGGHAVACVGPDEAVVPGIAFGIFACPIVAVLGNELFESVTGSLGEPQGGSLPGSISSQIRGRRAGYGPSSSRRARHGAGTLAALLRPHPVRELDTAGLVRHQPYRAEHPLACHDAQRKLTARGGIPGSQRHVCVAQRVGPYRMSTPQGPPRLPAGGLGHQGGVGAGQGTQPQIIAKIQIDVHELHRSRLACHRPAIIRGLPASSLPTIWPVLALWLVRLRRAVHPVTASRRPQACASCPASTCRKRNASPGPPAGTAAARPGTCRAGLPGRLTPKAYSHSFKAMKHSHLGASSA